MTAWVMLLRGINVGGTGKLPMAALKALLETLGVSGVTTYIQSGNVVFTGLVHAEDFEAIVADEIERTHGFRPRVLVIAADAYREIVASYPWPEALEAPKTGHVWFLAGPPAPDRDKLDALKADTERYEVAERAFYLHAPDGIGRSKLAERVERLLAIPATARNLNTCTKLVEMLDALEH